jgi:hypothetical protein
MRKDCKKVVLKLFNRHFISLSSHRHRSIHEKNFGEKSGQVQLLVAILFSLFIFTTIIIAQNVTNGFNQTNYTPIFENSSPEPINLCVNVTCENLTIECPDGWVASCLSTCDPITGECITCTPDCAGHELIVENMTNQTENFTEISNETMSINETVNETVDLNQTIPEPSTGLSLEISYPEKITRGEIVEIEATVVNPTSIVFNNVLINWQLPEGFEIISGSATENCGSLEPNSSCISVITVQTSFSTKLGTNDIKVVVSYG